MKVLRLLILLMHIGLLRAHTHAVFDKKQNSIEFVSELEILNQKRPQGSSAFTQVFTPLAPYDHITCVITAPKKACVGQPFVIDYTINVSRNTYVSFWADLIPDFSQLENQGMKLISIDAPTLGIFDQEAESVVGKGGRGMWQFPHGIPAGSHHIAFTLMAKKDGIKSFTSILATNPPSLMKSLDLIVSHQSPVAQNDFAEGYSGRPIVIPVLDNDYAACSLSIKSVQQPMHGSVSIAEDETLVYTSVCGYEGTDQFMYTIQDESGKSAQAYVNVTVKPAPMPQIIK